MRWNYIHKTSPQTAGLLWLSSPWLYLAGQTKESQEAGALPSFPLLFGPTSTSWHHMLVITSRGPAAMHIIPLSLPSLNLGRGHSQPAAVVRWCLAVPDGGPWEPSVPGQNRHPTFSLMSVVFLILMTPQKYLQTLAEHNLTVYDLESV